MRPLCQDFFPGPGIAAGDHPAQLRLELSFAEPCLAALQWDLRRFGSLA